MNDNKNHLFIDYDLRGILEQQMGKMFSEIDSMDGDTLLNTNIEEFCEYFRKKYEIEVPILKEEEISVDQSEAQIDVSGDRDRYIRDRSRPFYLTGTANYFYVPFEGDEKLFKYRASTYNLSPPMAKVSGSDLIFTYKTTDHDSEKIKSLFQRDLDGIKSNLEWIAKDVSSFNASLYDKAAQRIEHRKQKTLNDRKMVASLGFPLRRRSDAPSTYAVPEVKRKPIVRPPSAKVEPFVPEPTLEQAEYEHILSVVDNMVLVMERSPHAFKEMKEEDLRQHFLVQLNGQYEGQATGETFNFEGKTDILIRASGKNIFIAECKIWRGAKGFTDTINQILGYVSWRDTKTAIFIFNRTRKLSLILEQVPELLEKHENFKRFLEYKREGGFRAIFHHRDDPNRELVLTVHFYEVPA